MARGAGGHILLHGLAVWIIRYDVGERGVGERDEILSEERRRMSSDSTREGRGLDMFKQIKRKVDLSRYTYFLIYILFFL